MDIPGLRDRHDNLSVGHISGLSALRLVYRPAMRRSRVLVVIVLLVSSSMPVCAEDGKTAGEAFHNVQVLKRAPADQWFDTMAFIAGSLGVTCDHCHSSKFETDEGNPNKLKAREMMRMVDRINQDQFGGKVVVTCNTCHRGTAKPESGQIPDAPHWMRAADEPSSPLGAQEILARYRKSISDVKTQSVSLRVETYGGKGAARLKSAQLFLERGKARISERDDNHARTMLRNGNKAWMDEGKGWREMNSGETFDAFEVAEVFAPDQVGAVEPAGAVFTERINGQQAYVVPVTSKDGRKWLFFDPSTCLLLRQRQLSPSFYGDAAVDVNYKNYRKFGKAMLPTTVEVVNAAGAGLIVRRVISRKLNINPGPREFEATHN
jgi:hypothetical protein